MARWKGWGIAFRTAVMVWISEVFLHNCWSRISEAHAHGSPVGEWVYTQLAIWTAALLIWLGTGWWDLKRIGAFERENR